jgi:hypothetical protein
MPRYDVYTQITPATEYNSFKFISFGQKRTAAVQGLQKLIGLYTSALLTPIGSDPLDLLRGTNLTDLIGSNVGVRDAHDTLVLAVQKASSDVITNQIGLQIPDSERLANATVTQFIVIDAAPGFSAQVYIQNVANQGLTLLLPTLQVRV